MPKKYFIEQTLWDLDDGCEQGRLDRVDAAVLKEYVAATLGVPAADVIVLPKGVRVTAFAPPDASL